MVAIRGAASERRSRMVPVFEGHGDMVPVFEGHGDMVPVATALVHVPDPESEQAVIVELPQGRVCWRAFDDHGERCAATGLT